MEGALVELVRALFVLGAAQGVMGWLMVASGLVDRPSVSHYRLAPHISLAFAIFGYAVWLVRDLRASSARIDLSATTRRTLTRGLAVIGGLLGLQVVWGAFVAGLKAGNTYTTFPLMDGRLVPRYMLNLEAALLNFVHNPIAVQWVHRVPGTVLVVAALAFFVRVLRAGADRLSLLLNAAFFGLLAVQYGLGILTLIYMVPVALGVIHQATAMLLFGLWIAWVHHVRSAAEALAD